MKKVIIRRINSDTDEIIFSVTNIKFDNYNVTVTNSGGETTFDDSVIDTIIITDETAADYII